MTVLYDATELRRELHPLAELGLEVSHTADFVLEKLHALGIDAHRIADTNGVLGIIKGTEPGPVMMLRSDMDALPFKNPDGSTVAIHACGHDAHMAMLLAAASRLVGKIRRGTLKLLFQPAEETLEGAPLMIKKGVVDDVDIAIGAHIRPIQDLKPGTMCAGVMYNGFAFPRVTFKGKPAHGSRPHLGANAVDAAAAAIAAVNGIHMTPDVHWTIAPTQIQSDGPMNIIPSVCRVRFDVRAKSNPVINELLEKFKRAVTFAAESYGCEAEINIGTVGPAPDYDPELEKEISSCIEELGPGILAPNCGGGGEDFNFYKIYKPSMKTAYFGVGVGAAPGLHDRNLHFDDTFLPKGSEIFVKMALRHLG